MKAARHQAEFQANARSRRTDECWPGGVHAKVDYPGRTAESSSARWELVLGSGLRRCCATLH